ncbi:MAG: heat-shock protein [Gammaproteobacteria bacterium HGW-Gammaproteobacteria-14]|nr:MAG: heat-shock protein [Gammaproteobacteria bacterium HGW-Gammaproteobacteria-14]
MSDTNREVRLDKWLWAARFYKTRSIARDMIDGGKVQVDGQRGRPAKAIKVGMLVTLRQGHDLREVEVLAVSDQRGGAPQAATLYRETDASISAREQAAANRRLVSSGPDHRPDKKDRRAIDKFRRNQL